MQRAYDIVRREHAKRSLPDIKLARARIVLSAAAAMFLATWANLALAAHNPGPLIFWAANAAFVAVLLRVPASLRMHSLAGGVVAALAARSLAGGDPLVSAGLVVCDMVEVLTCVALLRAAGGRPDGGLKDQRTFLMFCGVGAGLGAAASVAAASLWLWQATGAQPWETFSVDYPAHALGLLVVLPPFLLRWREVRALVSPTRRAETLLSFAGLALLLGIGWAQTALPLIFLPLAGLLFLACQSGFAAATIGIGLTTAVSLVATFLQVGPLHASAGSGSEAIVVLQLFLGSCVLTTLQVVCTLAERQRLIDSLDRARIGAETARSALAASEGQYRRLAEYSNDMVMRFDTAGTCLYVSPAAQDLLGFAPDDLVAARAGAGVHPDDAVRFTEEVERLRRGSAERARSIHRERHRNGSWVWVEANLRLVRSSAGEPVEIVSIVRDMSDRVRLEERLRDEATTDGLTGLANRRSFDERLRQEWRRAERDGGPLALVLLDVDHFKGYNDRYGHAQGDACLREIASVLGQTRRASDLAARIGGEEFCLILPRTSWAGAHAVAESIRFAVAALGLEHRDGVGGTVTVSVGVALGEPHLSETPEALFKAADVALYEAKRKGRNRVAWSAPRRSARAK